METATIVILFLLGLWSIKHHYDNKWEIEQIKIEYKNLIKISKKANQQTIDEFERTRHYQEDMKTMQSDLTEFRQNIHNIDGKYKIKLRLIEGMLEKYSMPNPNKGDTDGDTLVLNNVKYYKNTNKGIAFNPMQNRSSAEKKAYNKLAKQISGEI
jgi:hypothetical protein